MEGKLKIVAALFVAVGAAIGALKGCHELRKASEDARLAEAKRHAEEDELRKRSQGGPSGKPAGVAVPPTPAPQAQSQKKATAKPPKADPEEPGPPAARPPKLVRVPREVVQPKASVFNNYLIQVQSLLLSDGELTCEVVITNLVADRRLDTANGGSASAAFANGTRVGSSSVELGGHKGYDLFTPGVVMPKDVPTKMVIVFRGVPPDATEILLLDLGFWNVRGMQVRGGKIQKLVAE